MSIYTRNRLLIFIIILLVALNVSTIVTVRHKMKQHMELANSEVEHYSDQRGKHFKEELGLNKEQFKQFKHFRKIYYPKMYKLQSDMHQKRIDLLEELSKEHTDTVRLHKLSDDIGCMHSEMKSVTNEYFLNLKSVCTREQQLILFKFYKAILAPGHGVSRGPYGKHRHNKDTTLIY